MKKIALFVAMLVIGISYASAQTADIKFDKTTHDFGTFSETIRLYPAYLLSLISVMLLWLFIRL